MARPIREVPWPEQRDNGWYYVNWYDPEQKRTFRESLKTRDAAVAATRLGEFLLAGPGRRARGAAGLTVTQALDDYWRQHVTAVDDKGRSLVVDHYRQQNIIDHLKKHFGDTVLKTIGPLESRAYLSARRSGKLSGSERRRMTPEYAPAKDSTVRRELGLLSAAANHAVKWGTLLKADLPRIELPKVAAPQKVKFFTKEELSRLLSNATASGEDDLHDFILVAYYTAARRRSVENLTAFQVDLTGGRIVLLPEGARATRKRKPIVPIYAEIRPTIEHRVATAGERNGRLWPRKTNGFYPDFVRLCARCGLEGHPHMLRHSRATHLLMAGADIYLVARLLGDTVQTVEQTYGHSSPEYLLKGIEALGK